MIKVTPQAIFTFNISQLTKKFSANFFLIKTIK